MNTCAQTLSYTTLLQVIKEHNAVPFTEEDFTKLMKYGKLFVKLPDNTKYTMYARYTIEQHESVEVGFTTVAVNDNGNRVTIYVKRDGNVLPPMQLRPLHRFDGSGLPIVASKYQSASWNPNRIKATTDEVIDQVCPKCGEPCNHTVDEMQGFALDALNQAGEEFKNDVK